ncbi:CLUMA_CG002840, isoform A [Clunio marinus]|uniref:CLUMA_CG002840, isoform A n=1 Tax=Clunio marinus TaxID=568069 RepID=A0A1J1HN29_9DIPT|nr:CLUMA_CG002840, isoform A [Clunio marinus]
MEEGKPLNADFNVDCSTSKGNEKKKNLLAPSRHHYLGLCLAALEKQQNHSSETSKALRLAIEQKQQLQWGRKGYGTPRSRSHFE